MLSFFKKDIKIAIYSVLVLTFLPWFLWWKFSFGSRNTFVPNESELTRLTGQFLYQEANHPCFFYHCEYPAVSFKTGDRIIKINCEPKPIINRCLYDKIFFENTFISTKANNKNLSNKEVEILVYDYVKTDNRYGKDDNFYVIFQLKSEGKTVFDYNDRALSLKTSYVSYSRRVARQEHRSGMEYFGSRYTLGNALLLFATIIAAAFFLIFPLGMIIALFNFLFKKKSMK